MSLFSQEQLILVLLLSFYLGLNFWFELGSRCRRRRHCRRRRRRRRRRRHHRRRRRGPLGLKECK